MAATGLSADPTEYRARLADQSDDQIDAWVGRAAARRRDPARHRQGRRRLPHARPASTSVDSNGCSLPAADHRPSVGHDAKGRLVVPTVTLFALVPGLRAQVAGRPRAPDRIPRDELRRDRLRLTGRRARRASGAAGRPGPADPPVPFRPRRRCRGRGRDDRRRRMPATALRLAVSMTALQVSIGTLNDIVDAPRDAGHKPGKPIPAGLVTPGIARAVVVIGGRARLAARGPVRAGDPRAGRRRPGHRIRLRPRRQGHGLVVAAVRGRDPAAAGLRLARGDRHLPPCLRRPRAGGRRRRRRAGHRQRQRGQRARRRRRRRFRGGPASARGGPGRSAARLLLAVIVAAIATLAGAPAPAWPVLGRRHRRRARHRSRHRRRARTQDAPGASARGSSRRSVSGCWPWPGWRGIPPGRLVAGSSLADQRDRVLEPQLGDRQVLGQVGAVGRADRRRGPRRCPGPRPARRRRRPGSAWR